MDTTEPLSLIVYVYIYMPTTKQIYNQKKGRGREKGRKEGKQREREVGEKEKGR